MPSTNLLFFGKAPQWKPSSPDSTVVCLCMMCWLNVVTYIFSPCFEAAVNSELQPTDVLTSSLSQYLLQHFMFDGFFSRVAQCQDKDTKDIVALKILKKRSNGSQEPNREVDHLGLSESLSSTYHYISNMNLYHPSNFSFFLSSWPCLKWSEVLIRPTSFGSMRVSNTWGRCVLYLKCWTRISTSCWGTDEATLSLFSKSDSSHNRYVALIILSKSSDIYASMEATHQHLDNKIQNLTDLISSSVPAAARRTWSSEDCRCDSYKYHTAEHHAG